jgi:hypothetical protein
MFNGQILAAGELDAISQQALGCLVELTAELQIKALQQLKAHFPQIEAIGARIRIFVDNTSSNEGEKAVSDLLNGVEIKTIQAFDAELEDAFIALLRLRPLAGQAIKDDTVPRFDKTLPDDKSIAIEAKQLTRDFDHFRAVDHINFTVKQGEIFGLLGANGAGKTTALYVFTTSGIGLFIATISRSLGQVTMLVILLLMPIILLSGAWTPPEAMPPGIHWAMYISPLYYFNEMSYAILLKGAGVDILLDSLLGLTVLGAVFFNFGVWRFRRQFG